MQGDSTTGRSPTFQPAEKTLGPQFISNGNSFSSARKQTKLESEKQLPDKDSTFQKVEVPQSRSVCPESYLHTCWSTAPQGSSLLQSGPCLACPSPSGSINNQTTFHFQGWWLKHLCSCTSSKSADRQCWEGRRW